MKVCVIGAGTTGLVTIKELTEAGHHVQCFDLQDREGGLFYQWQLKRATSVEYPGYVLTVSNTFIAFSSFPPPADEKRQFWTFEQYTDYLHRFATHFDLLRHIRFETEVKSVARCESQGTFVVETEHKGARETFNFDAIAVCAGSHRIPIRPAVPGAEVFKGTIAHSDDIVDYAVMAGKKVVSVGVGESAADLLHQTARVAKTLTMSIRHYPALIKRTHASGLVGDATAARTALRLRPTIHDVRLLRENLGLGLAASETDRLVGDWTLRGVAPRRQFFTKNEAFIGDVLHGRIKVNEAGLARLTEHKAVFNDGFEMDTDFVVLNTGFRVDFHFLDSLCKVASPRGQLWKHMMHADLGANLAFIGFARPEAGALPPVAELQARYFAQLLSGRRQLPSVEEMKAEMRTDKAYEDWFFALTPEIPTLVDYSKYADRMADLIGCRPRIGDVARKPKLLHRYLFGTQVAAQYRLRGPGAHRELAERTIERVQVAFDLRDQVDLVWSNFCNYIYELPLVGMRPEQSSNNYYASLFGVAMAVLLFFLGSFLPAKLTLLFVAGAAYTGYLCDGLKNAEATQERRVQKFRATLKERRERDAKNQKML